MNDNTTDYTYQELVEVVNWIYDAAPNTWIEMETDRSVLGESENCRCIKTECDCLLSSCVDYACDYVRAEKDVTGSVWAQKAYYFSTEVEVIDTVRNQCSDW